MIKNEITLARIITGELIIGKISETPCGILNPCYVKIEPRADPKDPAKISLDVKFVPYFFDLSDKETDFIIPDDKIIAYAKPKENVGDGYLQMISNIIIPKKVII